MQTTRFTIGSSAGPLPAYLARPEGGARPAVIILEGIYGFDHEIKRMTDLVAGAGYVGLAIDYLRGKPVAEGFTSADVVSDLAAARDWLNEQAYVQHGKIATWGVGQGGAAAFMAASLPGFAAAIVFYGQTIARQLPDGTAAPIHTAEQLRTPLLLVFGGIDEQITYEDIKRIETRLDAAGKHYQVQIYPSVGHSFFREDRDTVATREIADAWDLVQAFLSQHVA
jgi:carboxymethylenebutenolidase